MTRKAESWLEGVPDDAQVIVLIRHAERAPIPAGLPGDEVPLTGAGRQSARALGSVLGERLRSIRSSPVSRCLETASLICEGAALPFECPGDPLLGAPGAFIADPDVAWITFQHVRYTELLEALLTPGHTLPGFQEGGRAVGRLLAHLFQLSEGRRGLHLAVTHDYLVTVPALRLLGLEPTETLFAGYLEPAAFWIEGDRMAVMYRGRRGALALTALWGEECI